MIERDEDGNFNIFIHDLKQEKKDGNCIAIVAAMLTSGNIDEFKNKYKKASCGSYRMQDLVRHLVDYNLHIGACFEYSKGNMLINPKTITNNCFVVTVKSETIPGKFHLIIYCTKEGKIFDPNPEVDNSKRTLDSYEVTECWPLVIWIDD